MPYNFSILFTICKEADLPLKGCGASVRRLSDRRSCAAVLCRKLQADADRFIYFSHHGRIDMAYVLFQPPFVDRPDLFQKNDRILYDLIVFCTDFDMRRQLCLIHLRCNSRTDDRRAVAVPYIVLDHKDRADPALLRTDDWA